MKKLIAIVAILFIGCQTNYERHSERVDNYRDSATAYRRRAEIYINKAQETQDSEKVAKYFDTAELLLKRGRFYIKEAQKEKEYLKPYLK